MNPHQLSQGRVGRGAHAEREEQRSRRIDFAAWQANRGIRRAPRPLEWLGGRPNAFPFDTDATESLPELALHARMEREVAGYQERLRLLAEELLRVEERERRRLSMDLHDGLSQTMVLIKMKLGALRGATDPKLVDSVLAIEELVDQANQSARSIMFELYPTSLHDQGLEAAVRGLTKHIGARYGIDIAVEDDGQPKSIEAQPRMILFRSIRELLINAAKHARARRVCVRLERGERCIKVTVADDGIGMKSDIAANGGFGLFTIRERFEHVGGSMRVESAPAGGTKICLCAPLAKERRTKAKVSA